VCRSLEPATASATGVLGRLGDAPASRCKVAGSRLRRRPGCGRSPATRVSCRGVGSNECVALSRTTSVSFVAAGPCRPPPVPLSSDVVRWPLDCRVADASSETGRTSYPDRSIQAHPSRRLVRRDGDIRRDEPSCDGWVGSWTLFRSLEKGRICTGGSSSRVAAFGVGGGDQP